MGERVGRIRRLDRMKIVRILSVMVAFVMVLGLAALGAPWGRILASSHREAPLISDDPLADNTDVWAFVSPDKPDTVTIIASWYPFEEPAGGPNYYRFGDDVVYYIYVA